MSDDYTPRLFVKGGAEQLAGSVAAEIRLRFAGWRPKDEPMPVAHPQGPSPDADSPAKPSRSKQARSPE